VRTELASLDTSGRLITDISERVRAFAGAGSEVDGFVHVFLPHATAGLALIETGSGSEGDLESSSSDSCPAMIGTLTGTGHEDTAAIISSPRCCHPR
jgi:thiamine phosphate synthase YjbQ (UPF0047 family)